MQSYRYVARSSHGPSYSTYEQHHRLHACEDSGMFHFIIPIHLLGNPSRNVEKTREIVDCEKVQIRQFIFLTTDGAGDAAVSISDRILELGCHRLLSIQNLCHDLWSFYFFNHQVDQNQTFIVISLNYEISLKKTVQEVYCNIKGQYPLILNVLASEIVDFLTLMIGP